MIKMINGDGSLYVALTTAFLQHFMATIRCDYPKIILTFC
jgi:hypothetical protein